MKSFKKSLEALLVAGVCFGAFSANAYWCSQAIYSLYENDYPNAHLSGEAGNTLRMQENIQDMEEQYTNHLGIRKGNGLRPVRGTDGANENQIITQMKAGASNGANIISKSESSIDGINDFGDYSSAKSEINAELTVRPYSERDGKVYSTAEINEILENQRTAVNEFAANAIAMGAAETVNAAAVAAESDPEHRAKQIAKAETLAELYELMLGMDRRIYERSLHVSAVEATNAGVTALQVLTGASATSSGQ